MSELLYKVKKSYADKLATVEAEFLRVPNCKRCELLCDHIGLDGSRTIYARHRKRAVIFSSIDNGMSWQSFDLSEHFNVPIVRFHVMNDDYYLVQLVDEEDIIIAILSSTFSLHSQKRIKGYKWHGSLGVDTDDGVTLFSEYRGTNSDETKEEELRIFRLEHTKDMENVLESMQEVLKISALQVDNNNNIRHFHTVFSDNFSPNVWYASSGDNGRQNRVWKSKDRGLSWELLSFKYFDNTLSEEMQLRLLRFTSVIVTENKLIWATDDNLGINKSALVVVDKKTLVLDVKMYFGENLMRNLLRVNDNTLLGVSESKNDLNTASLFLIDINENKNQEFQLPNISGKKCPFTLSLAARKLHNNEIYISSLGNVLTKRIDGLLRIKIGVI